MVKSGDYMFIGEYSHVIDEKGRLAIPAKFRALLQGQVVVTKGLDKCLFVYSQTAWERIASKLASLPFNKANDRALGRHFLAGAMDIDFDSQGRINLPEYLRQFAGLSKKVVIAGLYDRLEVWDEAAWQAYKQATDQESNAIAEGLEGLGL